MQTLRFIVIAVVGSLAGCGGSSDPGGVPGDGSALDVTSSEDVIDSYVDALSDDAALADAALDASDADASDAKGCGVGACSFGSTCSLHCGSCYCESSGTWSCAVTPCDGGPSCPASEPAGDSACSDPWLLCSYPNACGGNDKAYCNAGKWVLSDVCCPATVPVEGSSCLTEGAHCSWPHGCGAFGDAFDNATCKDLHWSVMPSPCP